MKRSMIVALATLAMAAFAGVHAADIATTTYTGHALVRTDTHDRVVVALDTNDDGWADRVFLFDPYEPLPQGLGPREVRAVVTTSPNEFRLLADDGSLHLELHPFQAGEGQRSTEQSWGRVYAHGKALVDLKMPARFARLGAVDTDGVVTVIEGETKPCGSVDLGCNSGGEGSTGCSQSCGGFGLTSPVIGGSFAGESCGVSCDIARGYYACCNCSAGGAQCTCKTKSDEFPCPRGNGGTPDLR